MALGHNLTDQAETFLMRIIRGTGLTGLGGIYPVKEGIFIRPLIEIEKEEIETYLMERRVPFCIDRSNLDSRFLRNRIRIELLPFLKKRFSRKIISHIGKLSELIREEEELIEEIAENELKKIETEKDGIYGLDYRKLEKYPVALKRRILRSFIKRIKGNLRGITYTHIQSLLNLEKNKEVHLITGLKIRREGDLLYLKTEKSDKVVNYEYLLEENDEIEIKECELKFRTKVISSFDYSQLDFNDDYRGYLDYEKLKFPLLVRNRKNGDSYHPLGAPGKKKLKEIMRAKGIPLRERKNRPVFLSKNEIIWVLGLPVSEKYKVTPLTKKIFLIERIEETKS
ncbi:tRNA lysidine(34) synthetase TilS [Candidatus Aminicenantes bacterium AC-335-L06]|nr:tRNA lysidine(34) synthetase TilS [Candidatus Aminicenantes bacterium AC-335-L06]